ncbi:hypothetical protein GXW82_33615 [Streptacidiphilus sp. 4-A2]|nr:hypothetical protein [Streptacidiphilus sp. 4-A2]
MLKVAWPGLDWGPPTTVSVPPIWVVPSKSWSCAVWPLLSSSTTVMVAVP